MKVVALILVACNLSTFAAMPTCTASASDMVTVANPTIFSGNYTGIPLERDYVSQEGYAVIPYNAKTYWIPLDTEWGRQANYLAILARRDAGSIIIYPCIKYSDSTFLVQKVAY